MSLEYQQDDFNRRITVTATEPATNECLVDARIFISIRDAEDWLQQVL